MRFLLIPVFFGLSCVAHASFHTVKDIQSVAPVNTVTAMNMAGYINGSVCKQTALDLDDNAMFDSFDKLVKLNINYMVENGITSSGQAYLNATVNQYIFGLSRAERRRICERIYEPLK